MYSRKGVKAIIIVVTAINNNVKIAYPNPCEDVLFLEGNLTNSSILVYSSKGELVYKAQDIKEINVSNWKSGMYLITIFSNNEVITEKFMKN